MIRMGTEWSVSVHRDFEELMDRWNGRAAPEEMTGVLHVGFDRPPSKEFDSFVDHWRGLLLVTASARYALPRGFVTSEGTVGIVGDLPIHLGLRGWGYSVEPSRIPAVAKSTPQTIDRTPVGWVAEFVEQNPDAMASLVAEEIFDESTYLLRESRLSAPLRRSVGNFRLDKLLGENRHDPCAFARAAPPWLLEQDFDAISVSVRVANVFTNLEIRTVADLAELSLDELMQRQNFGRKSAADLLGSLHIAIREGPVGKQSRESEVQFSTLIEAINASLVKYPERARDVMLRRMGLGMAPETLNELGARYGVTRERIRQIEAKVTARLVREEVWDDILTAKLAGLLEERRIPLPLRGVEAADPWFAGVGEEGEALAYLLENVASGPSKVVQIDGHSYIGRLTQEEWDEAIVGLRRLLESAVEANWTFEHCRSLADGFLPERCKEFRWLLWESGSRQAQFVERNGANVLMAFGRGAEHVVQAVLAASDRPLHYSEIASLVRVRSGKDIELRRVHNAAASVGLLFGRGIYGLDQHVPLSQDAMADLADEAEQIVAEGTPGRQWHTSEMLAELVERGDDAATSIDKYIVDIALKRSGNLERLGRLVWSSSNASTETYRIELRQAIIACLQDAGGPLSTSDIRQRIRSMRGVDRLFQIAPADPLMRVAPGMWGLNDRDLSIKRPDQPRIVGALVELLSKRGTGLHYSELEHSPTLAGWGLTVTGFFSLATTDARLRVNTGRYLFLSEWGHPRRESLAEAVAVVLANEGHPLSLNALLQKVEARLGRPCERQALSACLQAQDAIYDAALGAWRKSGENEPEPDIEMAAE